MDDVMWGYEFANITTRVVRREGREETALYRVSMDKFDDFEVLLLVIVLLLVFLLSLLLLVF